MYTVCDVKHSYPVGAQCKVKVFGGQHASKADVAAIESLQLNEWNMNGGALFKR